MSDHAILVLGATDGDYLTQQSGLGRPEEQVRQEIATFAALRAEGDHDLSGAVTRIAGRPPKPFREYAREAAARGAWRPSP